MNRSLLTAAALVGIVVAGEAALAEEMKVEAVITTKDQVRLDFEDESKHFVALVRREGQASGQAPLAGSTVSEYGMHDVVPGAGGEGRGYLVFSRPDGSKAYIQWQVSAVFVPGPDGKPKLLDNGVWQVVGATGSLKGLKGAGSLHLKPVADRPTDRRFVLEGELAGAGAAAAMGGSPTAPPAATSGAATAPSAVQPGASPR